MRRSTGLWVLFISSIAITMAAGAIASIIPTSSEPLSADILSIIQSTIIITTIVIGIVILIFLTILLFRQQSNRLAENIQKLKTQEQQFYQSINADFESLLQEDIKQ